MLDENRTWTRQALFSAVVTVLETAGIPEARRNAEWLLGSVLGVQRAGLYAYPERPVPPEAVTRLRALVERRRRREPLQYVLGEADFFGLTLRVTPDVLIPRPETEEVVEAALGCLGGRHAPRVLDAGTGSGCIALAIRSVRRDARVFACDVSPAALGVARENARRLGQEVTFFEADILSPDFAAQVPADLDLLVANPPYVPPEEAATLLPEVVAYEPHRALFTDDDPLQFYRALVRAARQVVRPGGYVVFETHAEHGDDVCRLLDEAGMAGVELRPDLAGHPRIALARQP